MKVILIFLLTILYSFYGIAHQTQLSGKVMDDLSNDAIAAAKISILPMQLILQSNLYGSFSTEDLPAGNYAIYVEADGYENSRMDITIEAHESKYLLVRLSKKTIQLNEFKIKASQLSNANVLSKIDLSSRPVNTSQDLLRLVPGLFIAQHAGGGKAEQIFLRGFDCDHGTDIQISVDGMPVNMVSHAHGQGYADLHFLMPETIDRVNVSKGAYNAAMGNFATAGGIQFQTKNKIDHSMVGVEIGNFGMYRLSTMLKLFGSKLEKKNQHLYVAAESAYRKGFFDRPDHLNRMNLFAKYYGLIAKHHRLTAQISSFKSDWNASGQIPVRAVESNLINRFGSIDPTEGGRTGRFNASLKVESDLHKGNMLRHQVFYNLYDFDLRSNFTFYKNDTVHGDKIRQREHRQILGYNGSYFHHVSIGKIQLSTIGGIQLRYDNVKGNELSNVKANNELLQLFSLGNVNELNIGAYINQEIMFNKAWRLSLGLREDLFIFKYQNTLSSITSQQLVQKAIFSPKLNIYYQANKNLQWFFLSGIGFHSNDTRVVVVQQGHQILPKSFGAEFGLNAKPKNQLLITASLWSLYLQQEFVYVGDEAIVEPSGETRRVGIDLSARYDINRFIYADVDINFSSARALGVSNEESRIPLAPTITSVGGLNVNMAKGLVASCRYRYLANRPANENGSLIAKGYFINDLLIRYTKKRIVFGLSAENLFNINWKEAQFETESQLKGELQPVSEIHFTSGTPLFLKASLSYQF